MSSIIRFLSFLAVLGLLTSCDKEKQKVPAEKTETKDAQVKKEPTPEKKQPPEPKVVTRTEVKKPAHFQNHWSKVPDPKKQSTSIYAIASRKAARLKVAYLKKTIPFLLGGVRWTRYNNGLKYDEDMFDVMAKTLGQADYHEMTTSITSPSLLFMKFMDDMSAQVCKKAVDKDLAESDETKRVFVRFPSDPKKNLRFVRLKFHAVFVPETSEQEIKALYDLYRKASQQTWSKSKAWQTVCIVTLTSSEFLLY